MAQERWKRIVIDYAKKGFPRVQCAMQAGVTSEQIGYAKNLDTAFRDEYEEAVEIGKSAKPFKW